MAQVARNRPPGPEFRVFLSEKCIVNPSQRRVTADSVLTVVPKLIEGVIGGIAGLLKKAGDKESVQVTNGEVLNLYLSDSAKGQQLEINPRFACIIGVYGVFAKVADAPDPYDPDAQARLENAGLIPKDSDLSMIFEAAIVPTTDRSAFYLDVRYFSVREFIGKRMKSDRAFVATLAVKTPSETVDGKAFAVGNIDLGRFREGEKLVVGAQGKFPRYLSNLMPFAKISEEAAEAHRSSVTAVSAGRKAAETPEEFMPVTASLTLTETADGSAFLAALAEILDGAKEEAAADISQLILPKDAETLKKEDDDIEALYAAEEDANIAVLEAEATLAKAKAEQDTTEEELKVLEAHVAKAKRAKERAEGLRKAAGLPDPKAFQSLVTASRNIRSRPKPIARREA